MHFSSPSRAHSAGLFLRELTGLVRCPLGGKLGGKLEMIDNDGLNGEGFGMGGLDKRDMPRAGGRPTKLRV